MTLFLSPLYFLLFFCTLHGQISTYCFSLQTTICCSNDNVNYHKRSKWLHTAGRIHATLSFPQYIFLGRRKFLFCGLRLPSSVQNCRPLWRLSIPRWKFQENVFKMKKWGQFKCNSNCLSGITCRQRFEGLGKIWRNLGGRVFFKDFLFVCLFF